MEGSIIILKNPPCNQKIFCTQNSQNIAEIYWIQSVFTCQPAGVWIFKLKVRTGIIRDIHIYDFLVDRLFE
jgi:hypothetical protein